MIDNTNLSSVNYPGEVMVPDDIAINHPAHYKVKDYEVVDIIEAFVDAAEYKGSKAYHFATIMKYLLRHPFKGMPVRDLKKMRWHLTRLINIMENE